MPITLPNLDDRKYVDLVEDARSLIPTYAPEWTNHNPSDPGITLIELFAFLAEMLIYRLNRVTDDNRRKFLKLLNGPDWQQQKQDLREEVRLAVLGLHERNRAITCADFELLVIESFNRWLVEMQQKDREGKSLDEWWRITGLDSTKAENLPSKVKRIIRAHCVPQKYLDAGNEMARQQPKPGHVSVIIVPEDEIISGTNELGPQPTPVQRQALWGYLDERRTLTTRHHVVGPFYAPVSVEILVARRSDVPTEKLRNDIKQEIENFLHPLPGPRRKGWPFGRDVHVSEFYEVLEKLEGVDYLPDLMLLSACKPEDKHCVAAEPIWQDNGDLIGLRLYAHHLPAARIDPNRIVIAPNVNFLAVQLVITVTQKPSADRKILKRLIKMTMRNFFHPLHGGPGPNTSADTDMMLQTLKQAVKNVEGVQQVDSINLESDPSRLRRDAGGNIIGVRVKAGEVVDLRARVEVG